MSRASLGARPGPRDAAAPVSFRPAGGGDAEAVARVHYEAARRAYRGVLPDELLEEMSYQQRLALWGGLLMSGGAPPRVELAVRAPEGVVGFAWWRKIDGPKAIAGAFGAEVVALYVLPGQQGQGLGRALLAHTAGRMAAAGLGSCYVWAFEAHVAARGFYEALGGRLIDRDWEVRGDLRVPIVSYAWRPLETLMAAETSPEVGR